MKTIKAIIKVEEFDKCYKFIGESGHEVWFNKDELEIIDEEQKGEPFLTEERAKDMYLKMDQNNLFRYETLECKFINVLKENNFIIIKK